MSAPEPSPEFKRDLRTVVRDARTVLSVGFAAISADLAWLLVPQQHAWWACGVVAGTMVMVYWWVWGRIFRNVGLVVEAIMYSRGFSAALSAINVPTWSQRNRSLPAENRRAQRDR
jgi:phosphate/sulfate permease